MSEVWITFIQKHKRRQEQKYSKLLSFNCAGCNLKELFSYKQYLHVIKWKKKKLNEIENWWRKWIITKILGCEILLKRYLSFFHLGWIILASIHDNAKAKFSILKIGHILILVLAHESIMINSLSTCEDRLVWTFP